MRDVPQLGDMMLDYVVSIADDGKISVARDPEVVSPKIYIEKLSEDSIGTAILPKFPFSVPLKNNDASTEASLVDVFGPQCIDLNSVLNERWFCLLGKIYFRSQEDATLYVLRFK